MMGAVWAEPGRNPPWGRAWAIPGAALLSTAPCSMLSIDPAPVLSKEKNSQIERRTMNVLKDAFVGCNEGGSPQSPRDKEVLKC